MTTNGMEFVSTLTVTIKSNDENENIHLGGELVTLIHD